jgi:hypothetical protein
MFNLDVGEEKETQEHHKVKRKTMMKPAEKNKRERLWDDKTRASCRLSFFPQVFSS